MPSFWLIIGVIGLCGLLYLIFLIVLLWKRKFVLLLVFLLLPLLSYKIFQYYWFTKILPAQIEVTYPLSLGTESGLIREGCGVAVFKVSQRTLQEIQSGGLTFLNSATKSRGYSDPYHQFELWQESPAPLNWVRNGTWFMCSQPEKTLSDEIIKAAKRRGSYYTTKPEGQLFIIPSLGYVVLSYSG